MELVPAYKYECNGCGHQKTEFMSIAEHDTFSPTVHAVPPPPPDPQPGALMFCGVYMQVYEFRIAKPMPEHYSDTLDSVVSSHKDFEHQLREKSRHDSERHGFDINYEPVDPTDASSAGVTEAGLETQARRHHDDALT